MATDIAFAVGVLALLGRHVAPVFKVFLTAVAVVDDLIAVLVIAFFYTVRPGPPRARRRRGRVRAPLRAEPRGRPAPSLPYLLVGVVLWAAMAKSGVHATIAGVLLGMCIPATGSGDLAAPPARARPPPLGRVGNHAGLRARERGRDGAGRAGRRDALVADRARNRPRALLRQADRDLRDDVRPRAAQGRRAARGPPRAAVAVGGRAPRRDRVHDVALRERSRVHATRR